MTLRQRFKDDFASSAFQTHCGDDAIVGKFGVITELDDGTVDVWFVYPDGSPLSERKLTILEENTKESGGIIRLTGEAYTQGKGDNFVREIAPYVGVKKKKRVSEKQKAQGAANLAKARSVA